MRRESPEADDYGLVHYPPCRSGAGGLLRDHAETDDLREIADFADDGDLPEVRWDANAILAWMSACRPRQMRDMLKVIDAELRMRGRAMR